MKTKLTVMIVTTFTLLVIQSARAQGTAFTYQGRLTSGTNVANGNYDVRFTLFATNALGTPVAGPITNSAVQVSNGLLTASVDFGPGVFTGGDRWLEVAARSNSFSPFAAIAPRQQLTPVPYAHFARSANSLSVGSVLHLFADQSLLCQPSIVINKTNCDARIVFRSNDLDEWFLVDDANGEFQITDTPGGDPRIALPSLPNAVLLVPGGGNVGIGTTTPAYPLDINSSGQAVARLVSEGHIYGSVVELKNVTGSPSYLGAINFNNADDTNPGQIAYLAGGDMTFKTAGAEHLRIGGNGNVSVCVLTITGGCDLAEPFNMSETEIPKGALVVIDEANPGKLKLSHQAYDTRVAGIVSGANGINPGITLHKEGTLEGGENVALSGRVYALADASHGAIKPGDLLTTSDIPGHCMKVANPARAQGAIIGKAMTGLEKGKGMVLVLVSLQ